MADFVGLFLELFAGAAPKGSEYGKAAIAAILGMLLIGLFLWTTLQFVALG